jgi:transposase
MMGRLNHNQGQLFYSFHLDEVVPDDHLVREIAAVLDLSWVHRELAAYYPKMGRPSIDPELMIRMLIVGYVFAIRSERMLCREVKVNLAYRWFCGLSIEDSIPDHSAFSRARHERFRDGDIFRRVFERVVEACIAAVWQPRASNSSGQRAWRPMSTATVGAHDGTHPALSAVLSYASPPIRIFAYSVRPARRKLSTYFCRSTSRVKGAYLRAQASDTVG